MTDVPTFHGVLPPDVAPDDLRELDEADKDPMLKRPGSEPVQDSPLEVLRREAAKEAERPPVTLSVPGRDNWEVRYRTDVKLPAIGRYQRAAKDKSQPDGIDMSKLFRILLANQCEAFLHDGAEVAGSDGQLLVFASPEFMAACGVGSAIEAVEHWYGSDGSIAVAVGKVMEASGFDEDALTSGDVEDPTKRS